MDCAHDDQSDISECDSDVDEDIDFQFDSEPISVSVEEDSDDDEDDDGLLEEIPSLGGEVRIQEDGHEVRDVTQYLRCSKCQKKFPIQEFLDIHISHCSKEGDIGDGGSSVSKKY